MTPDPAAEYRSRLAHWRERFDSLSVADARLAAARLVTFGGALVLGYADLADLARAPGPSSRHSSCSSPLPCATTS